MQNETIGTANRELKLSRILNAPIELVWEVFITPEHLKEWWGPTGFTTTIRKMDVVEGAEWLLTMHGPDGTDYPNRSVFTEIVENKRIQYRHYEPNFTNTIDFEQQGDKTLILWHMLFDSVAEFELVVKTYGADEGLKQNIEKLIHYLSQKTT